MQKDRGQKAEALRYVVSKRWYPQLELDVSTYVTVQRSPVNITDVDVFASIPGELGSYSNVLIDCKTRRGESPINRALWQRGLMERIHADRGICILRRKGIETDHRYTAARLGVTLLTEDEFHSFAKATSPAFDRPTGVVGEIEAWERFFQIGVHNPIFENIGAFSRSGFWMAESEIDACTRSLWEVSRLSQELDPVRHDHLAIVADAASWFMHALARIVNTIFAGYLLPKTSNELSSVLLLLLYGGREAYRARNRMKKMLAASRGETAEETPDLSLPEWERFVQLVRQSLDAPYEITRSPLILRETAFVLLVDGSPDFIRVLSSESPQAARLAVLGTDYLCRATRLPPEFSTTIATRILEAQSTQSI